MIKRLCAIIIITMLVAVASLICMVMKDLS
jgi:hypothetical protein